MLYDYYTLVIRKWSFRLSVEPVTVSHTPWKLFLLRLEVFVVHWNAMVSFVQISFLIARIYLLTEASSFQSFTGLKKTC